jgi:transcription elongation factor GreA
VVKELRERLEAEIRDLEREFRTELPREIQRARELGDLRENAEYKAALERQSYVSGRIAHLYQQLSEISRINLESLPTDSAHIGSTVVILDLESEEETTYEIVIPGDGDGNGSRISSASPLGRGLIGRKVGDEVRIRVPSGMRNLEIISLRTIHEQLTSSGESED